MEAISQTVCSFQEEMGLQSIHNQCFHNISGSFLLQNRICILHTAVLHLYLHCTLSMLKSLYSKLLCFVLWPNSRMSYTRVFHVCSCSWLCVSDICVLVIFSNDFSHSVPYKIVQKVCVMLWISEVACSTHVFGIISGTVQGWNQWHSRLQDGFCFIPHSQDTDCHYIL